MNTMRLCPLALLLVTGFVCGDQMADEAGRDQAAVEWLSRFAFVSPAVSMDGVAVPSGGELPAFSVVPAMTGRQLVRVSLPFVPGTFPAELSLAVSSGDQTIVPDVRFLTFHPGRPRFVRRAMVTFPYDFSDARPRMFQVILRPSEERTSPTTQPGRYSARVGEIELQISDKGIEIRRPDQVWRAELLAPDRRRPLPAVVEVVEQGNHYLWVRLMVPDPDWPRIIEVRADSLGGVGVRGHLQRLLPHDGRGRSPDFGWRIHGPKLDSLLVSIEAQRVSSSPTSQSANPVSFETLSLGDKSVECSFESGKAVRVTGPACSLDFPDAHLHKRGWVVANGSQDSSEVTYWR